MIQKIAKKKPQENSPDDGAGWKRVIANHPEWEKKSVLNFIAVYTIYIYTKCESQGGIKSRRIVKVSRTRPLRLSIVSTKLTPNLLFYTLMEPCC